LRKQFETLTDLRAEIKSLQTDNLKLYEKVRYVNSYRDTPAGPSGTSGSGGGGLSGVLTGARRDEEMGRYKDKYEESMNPFEAFKGRVSLSICLASGGQAGTG
jgi:homeobox protein cut-like